MVRVLNLQKGVNMFNVDNSGKGNCLYYAYSISLMYYLRAKNNVRITEDIFNKLGLKEEDRARLRKLLSKDPDRAFTRDEIKTIIEPILGRAMRDLAAEHTKVEFKSSPHDTPLFSSLHYAVEFGFKRSLQINESELTLLIDNDFSNPDYTEAEIYKVSGLLDALQEYILTRTPSVIEEFNRQWENKKQELKEQSLTEKEIQIHQATILDNILRKETIDFLLADNEKHLDEYREHLRREFVWGSEETLMVLHRAIQGERMVRNHEGKIEPVYDHEIILHVHRNGASPSYQAGSPEMILNNEGNVHWTSIITDAIFTSKLTDKEEKLLEMLERMQSEYGSKELGVEKYSSISDWLSDLMKQIELIKTSPTAVTKQKEIELFFQLLAKATPKLASEPALRMSLGTLFSNFLECIPALMVENKLSTGLAKFGLYSPERTPVISQKKEDLSLTKSSEEKVNSDQSQKGVLSQFSKHTLLKVSEEITPKPYPTELNPYVRKNKQSGPRVARALTQMYQKGLEGDERYTPEKCKNIAQRYIEYSKSHNRNFILDDVILFVQEMDKIIKQKETISEVTCKLAAM
ncbi:TPA: Dot/Icm T4SS effector Lem27 [Legionella pneumophila]|nr:Dot/Icm T4SS effector Lem27 [Legionella pneumophila]HBD7208965.1 Dot/Icm T4SS effector Lem27 [Legionella pneumophila]HBD7237186.1 Dot/Icm T4SS effector Lem27 [Legionella pneumophila]HBD7243468.1 Dot/Icm T4SS effector Lem27 [Legionella pneumophila]HCJ1074179.1 Dot/Icm T4SS effector Lem27 [Legionella pneumophila]